MLHGKGRKRHFSIVAGLKAERTATQGVVRSGACRKEKHNARETATATNRYLSSQSMFPSLLNSLVMRHLHLVTRRKHAHVNAVAVSMDKDSALLSGQVSVS